MGQGGKQVGRKAGGFFPLLSPVSGQKAEMVSPLRWTLWVIKNGTHGEKHIKAYLPIDDMHIHCAIRKQIQVSEERLVNSQILWDR